MQTASSGIYIALITALISGRRQASGRRDRLGRDEEERGKLHPDHRRLSSKSRRRLLLGGVRALDYLRRAVDLGKAQPEDNEDGIARIDEALNGWPASVARSLTVLPS